jgi:hypothetical protein
VIHNSTQTNPDGDHYAVGISGMSSLVLAQLQENGNQARIALTPTEARHMAELLLAAADKVSLSDG